MSTESPGTEMSRFLISLLLLIVISGSGYSRPYNNQFVVSNPNPWISPYFQPNYFVPYQYHQHPQLPQVMSSHIGGGGTVVPVASGYSSPQLIGSQYQNYFPRLYYYPNFGQIHKFPLPVPQYHSVPLQLGQHPPRTASFINQPISATFLREQQQRDDVLRTHSKFGANENLASIQQNQYIIPSPAVEPIQKEEIIHTPPEPRKVTSTFPASAPPKLIGTLPHPAPEPPKLASTLPAPESPKLISTLPALEPPKRISTLPPPTAEEEEHLTKFEEEYELLKLVPNQTNQNRLPSFQQFTPAEQQAKLQVPTESESISSEEHGFDEPSKFPNLHSKFDIRLPNYVNNKRKKPRRSTVSEPNKQVFAVITAVMNHNSKRRRQRQLQPNDLEIPITDEDLPPLLIGDPEKKVPIPSNDSGEIMEFSDEEKLEPTNRLLLPGTARSLAMMNFYKTVIDGEDSGNKNAPRLKKPEQIPSFDYEVSNDSFGGDEVAKDFPPTLFIQKAGELDSTSSFESQKFSPEEKVQIVPDSARIGLVKDSETDLNVVSTNSNSDLPPLPTFEGGQLFDDNSEILVDGLETTESPPPPFEQNSDSVASSLSDINTSDLPPLPGSLFQDDIENSNNNNTPNYVQVDDLISADLPPLPDISLFPISNQNDVDLPAIPLPQIPAALPEIPEAQPQIPDFESQPQLPEPQPQIPEVPYQIPEPPRQTPETYRPVFPSGGNLPPIFPEPEEEPPIPSTTTPTTTTTIFPRVPKRTTTATTTTTTTERTELFRRPPEVDTMPNFPPKVSPPVEKVDKPNKKSKKMKIAVSSEEEEDTEPQQANNNDWIRDIALKALDRGISVQHIYSINVGKIHMKSEGQVRYTQEEHPPGFVTTFVKTFEQALSQAVAAVSKSVVSSIGPAKKGQSQRQQQSESGKASKSKESPVQSIETSTNRSPRIPLPIDPRLLSKDENGELSRDINERKSPPNPRIPLDIDFRVLDVDPRKKKNVK